MAEMRQLAYLVIQKARLSAFFRIISIKPWGVAAARGVGGKREGESRAGRKKRKKNKKQGQKERGRDSV